MKKSELQKIIREEIKSTLKEAGELTTYLAPAEVESLTAIMTKIDNLKAAIETTSKMINNKEIQRILTVGGLPDLNMLRARMSSISQLKEL